MKRFFQRLDQSSSFQRGDYQRANNDSQRNQDSHCSSGSFIGKMFTIGQYQCTVEDVIAEGGFALVFLVKANNGIRYALKRLYVNSEQDLSNCKREIEIAKKLGSHKNIVQMVESTINYCGNEVYEILMLMQYCKGQLLQLMNDKLSTGFNESDIIKILCDLCEAIARLHHNEPPIIHRDLKIENILISDDGNYMICDFGSATTNVLSINTPGLKALSIEEEIKRYTTLSYRSPEMVDIYLGQAITTKADIWALGCLIYKLCYFSLPFGESMLAIQNAQLTVPDSYVDRYSSRLTALIAYMLIPDPQERPDIFQVAYLAFDIIGSECQVKNHEKSKIPVWSNLKTPSTESQLREQKQRSAASTSTVNATTTQPTIVCQVFEPEKTTVTPRQRPKATININSVLPTSPVNLQQQRSTTPNETNLSSTKITSIANNNSSSKTDVSVTNSKIQQQSQQKQLSNSLSFSSSNQLSNQVDNGDAENWSSKTNKQKTQTTFCSNPQLNENYEIAMACNNPFIGSINEPSRRTQTPPGNRLTLPVNKSNQIVNSDNSNESSTSANVYHHRRNMSDTSAFNFKQQNQTATLENTLHQSTSNEFLKTGSINRNHEMSFINKNNEIQITNNGKPLRNWSLNPFENTNDYDTYEDQLFGHEFDKIRNDENVPVSNIDHDPFEAAPFDSEQLKQYLERKKQINIEKIEITKKHQDESKSSIFAQKEITSNNPSVTITIKPNNEYAIVNNSSHTNNDSKQVSSNYVDKTEASSHDLHDESDQVSKVASTNKSISSSSQGIGITTNSPTTIYMPLYSSDTAEDDDDDNIKIDEIVNEEINNRNDDLIIVEQVDFESSTDMTKPLVDDEDDDDDEDEEENDEDGDDKLIVIDDGSVSSIGSASDLQYSDDSDEDSNDDENDSSSIAEDTSNDDKSKKDDSSEQYSDDENEDDEKMAQNTRYNKFLSNDSTNMSKLKKTRDSDSKFSNISRIQITSTNMVTLTSNNNDDCTSVSNSSLRSDSQKNIDSLDHLIGHIEANRPLLEDDDDDEPTMTSTTTTLNASQVKPFIEMDSEPLFDSGSDNIVYDKPTTIVINYNETSSIEPSNLLEMPLELHDSYINSQSNTNNFNNAHSDFDTLSLTQHTDESDENRQLDEEVERNLIPQVIYDQMNNKDLFGSIPFTNKDLISQKMLQQKENKENRFENSFSDVPIAVIQESANTAFVKVEPTAKSTTHTLVSAGQIESKSCSTDLFGSIPFSASSVSVYNPQQEIDASLAVKSTEMSTTDFQQVKPFLPPLTVQRTILKSTNPATFKKTQQISVSTSVPIVNKNALVSGTVIPSIQQSNVVVSTSTSSTVKSTTASLSQPIQPASSSVTVSTSTAVVANKLNRNLLQKSNLKIKSKVAKKYEVDESDDEVDGLLDQSNENEDDFEQPIDSANSSLKKKKKDKKDKEKDKKSKEFKLKDKKEEKKIKIKQEKLEKEEKKKIKDKDKSDKVEKEKKIKEKKKKKEIKDKKEKISNKSSIKEEAVAVKEPSSLDGSKDLIQRSLLDSTTVLIKGQNSLLSQVSESLALKSNNLLSTESTAKESTSKNNSKEMKTSKKSSSNKQAFANMSFEDEMIQHYQQQKPQSSNISSGSQRSSTNNTVTITRC